MYTFISVSRRLKASEGGLTQTVPEADVVIDAATYIIYCRYVCDTVSRVPSLRTELIRDKRMITFS